MRKPPPVLSRTIAAVLAVGSLALPQAVQAIPALQIYIDGATWDATRETWVTQSREFDLWVIGDVEDWGHISDVKLAASGYNPAADHSITLTPKQTDRLPDPSTPSGPVQLTREQAAALAIPTAVSQHDEFRLADDHTFWKLGNFTSKDSPIGDFQDAFPTRFPSRGQINVYHVSFTGYDALHFDAWGNIVGNGRISVVFAPNSHDAGTAIPEPGTLVLVAGGLAAAAWRRRRR